MPVAQADPIDHFLVKVVPTTGLNRHHSLRVVLQRVVVEQASVDPDLLIAGDLPRHRVAVQADSSLEAVPVVPGVANLK